MKFPSIRTVLTLFGLFVWFSTCALITQMIEPAAGVALASAPVLLPGDTMRARAVFDQLRKDFQYQIKGPDGKIMPSLATSISLSTLKQERVLRDATSLYNFDFVQGNAARATDILLNRNDRFAILGARLYVKRETVATLGKAIPQFYGNPAVFATATEGLAADIDGVLANGQLSLIADQRQLITGLEGNLFRHVPAVQQGTINAAASDADGPLTTYAQANSEYANKVGFVDIEPLFTISGDGKNQFSYQFPSYTGIDIEGTATIENVLGLELYGFLIAGVNV